MNPILWAVLIAGALFLAMMGAQFLGSAIGQKRLAAHGEKSFAGGRPVEAAVFALLGLLIAFTFAGANSRFDQRRSLVVEQVNALSTAWLRLDLLPSEDTETARALFRSYATGIYDAAVNAADSEAVVQISHELEAIEDRLWRLSVEAAKQGNSLYVATLVLPPLNQVFDLTTSRLLARHIHVQGEVIGLLLVLILVSAVMVGHAQGANGRRDVLHMAIFAGVVSLALYVILDLEFPRVGLITVDASRDFLADFLAGL